LHRRLWAELPAQMGKGARRHFDRRSTISAVVRALAIRRAMAIAISAEGREDNCHEQRAAKQTVFPQDPP
jgi:hypothetical protein